MAAEANSTKVVVAAMIGNGLIAVSKFVAAFFTGSASTLAEAVHSVADTTNQFLLIVGLRRAKRGPTALHAFGHAGESYFWPFLVSILIFLLGGAFALYEGVHGLVAPEAAHEHGNPLWNYGVLGLATLFELYSLGVAVREFKKLKGSRRTVDVILKTKDPTIPVVLLEDAAALVGLLLALAAVGLADATGWVGWDSIGSIAIGLVLFAVSFLLSRETHSLLIGESASDEDRELVVSIVEKDAAVERATQFLSMHRGPDDVLLALKVGFRRGLSIHEVEAAIDRIEDAVRAALPRMKHIFIEPDARYEAGLDEHRAGSLAAPRRAKPA